MVICSGTTDKGFHKCEERKCKHRILHKSIKGRCNVRNHNGEDCWCVAPGTVSLLDGYEDGSLVSCMTSKTLVKEERKSLEYYLSSAIENKNNCKVALKNAKENYVKACELIDDIQKRLKK